MMLGAVSALCRISLLHGHVQDYNLRVVGLNPTPATKIFKAMSIAYGDALDQGRGAFQLANT